MGAERGDVARGRLALGERGPGDVEAVVLDGIEHPQARVGAVARQQDHLDVLLVGTVDGQQLLDQRERGAGRQDLVLVLDLVAMVGGDAGLGVDVVALGEVEQRARRDRDDELVGEGGLGHPQSIVPIPRAAAGAVRGGDRYSARSTARSASSVVGIAASSPSVSGLTGKRCRKWPIVAGGSLRSRAMISVTVRPQNRP